MQMEFTVLDTDAGTRLDKFLCSKNDLITFEIILDKNKIFKNISIRLRIIKGDITYVRKREKASVLYEDLLRSGSFSDFLCNRSGTFFLV